MSTNTITLLEIAKVRLNDKIINHRTYHNPTWTNEEFQKMEDNIWEATSLNQLEKVALKMEVK